MFFGRYTRGHSGRMRLCRTVVRRSQRRFDQRSGEIKDSTVCSSQISDTLAVRIVGTLAPVCTDEVSLEGELIKIYQCLRC